MAFSFLQRLLTSKRNAPQPVRRPNILFIMADQFRADALGATGGWTRTRNLNRLAERGVVFENVYANSVECIPSRISLATGLYPHQTGIDINRTCTLNPDFPNWMQALEQVGYQTSLIGKTHLHPHEGDLNDRIDLMHGYGLQNVDEITGPRASAFVKSNMTRLWEEQGLLKAYQDDFSDRFGNKPFVARPSVLPLELYYDRYVGDSACRQLRELANDRPWFTWVSFGGPHEPWDAPEPYASMYRAEDMPKPIPRPSAGAAQGLLKEAYASTYTGPDISPEEVAALRANYAGNVTLIDDEIGRVLKVVDELGQTENTLVIFTSDHGEMNGDFGLIYKSNFLDPAARVPLIVAWPGRTNGERSKALIELMDVAATMLDYADAKLPEASRAISFRNVIEGHQTAHRDSVLSEFAGHGCLITSRYKAEFDLCGQPSLLIRREYDAFEQNDLVSDSRLSGSVAALQSAYFARKKKTPNVTEAVIQ
ncbi:sulfatase-like hydrolase/transferase [Mesorhizobium sp.]|uniref:sulfatase family protein n=1 Tax=Mesorhizobium sp. TaxID=1871066 RepID=UPI000FE45B30|nr:sulfatase-like hydrolase/transferase [Mesorhizobium sp.]RWC62588.1 MAG: hypothetical protein EOS29_16180 [Mesorhizobium sp.]RWC63588.1 MAG: hypothetical protein EOS56_02685 [Mesorhizobium sp.]